MKSLCALNGCIVWEYGVFACGKWPDSKFARLTFVSFLDEGKKALADKGYNGSNFLILRNATNQSRHKYIMRRHETINMVNINKGIRQFNVFNVKFRHPLEIHKNCFHVIVNLMQFLIKHEPLYSIKFKKNVFYSNLVPSC